MEGGLSPTRTMMSEVARTTNNLCDGPQPFNFVRSERAYEELAVCEIPPSESLIKYYPGPDVVFRFLISYPTF